MVLNSNGIHGVAHQLAARVQSAGYPITYVGNAQRRGLPTIVQYAKGYGPAARKLARLVGNVQFVTPFDGITPARPRARSSSSSSAPKGALPPRLACGAGVAGCDDLGIGAGEDRVVARQLARALEALAPARVVPAVALVAGQRQPGAVVLGSSESAWSTARRASSGRPSCCSRLARSSCALTEVRSRAAASSASTRASSVRPWVSSWSARPSARLLSTGSVDGDRGERECRCRQHREALPPRGAPPPRGRARRRPRARESGRRAP